MTLFVGNSTVNSYIESTNAKIGANSTFTILTANATGIYSNSTLVANSTGPYGKTEATLNVNSALTANNSTNLGGTAAASYQLNSTLNANIASYLPTYTGVVNGSSHTVGTAFTANATVVNAVTYYVGSTLIANSTGPYGKTEGNLNVNSSLYANLLLRIDDRIIIANDFPSQTLRFGFTSFNNNNTSPYADFLHMRSYTDSSGGSDNLLMFNKSAIGVRVYQAAWTNLTTGNTSAYTTYKDLAFTDGTNSTGTWSINTSGTANNASYLGGTIASSYQLNSTLNANIAAYLPTYTGIVNGSSHTVGTSTIANSTGVYTGVVNGSSHTVGTAFTANATVVNAVSYYAGTTLIGNTTGPYGKTEATLNVNSALTANNSTNLGGTAAASYALLASPTFTGTITASNATFTNIAKSTNGLTEPSGYRITNPGGGASVSSTASVTGAIKIKLPTAVNDSNTMMRITVKIYEYAGTNAGTARTLEMGAYNYGAGVFGNHIFATQSTMGGGDINVRFGSDGTGNCIWIGELATAWAYPQVFITEVQCGYAGYNEANWSSGWAISFVTAFDTVESGPIIAAKPLTSQNYNSYAPTLTGTGASGTWNITANNAAYLGGTAASGYQTTAGLSANVATLTANNADYLDGQHGAYYTNATNISTGTLSAARGGTNSSLTPVSGGVVYSNATGMAITAAGTNTFVLASNGTVPVFTQIDMAYLPEATFKKSCRAATTADLSAASATAQVLTGGLVALPAQDGVTLVLNDRLLVKDQSNTAQNGIFYVSNTGSAAAYAWTLTRATDANSSSRIASSIVAIDAGTVNGGRLFDNDFKTTDTLGTTAMSWSYNIDGGGGVFTGSVYPNSNTLLLGNATSRWVVSANTINASGLITGAGGATITGITNTSTAFYAGTTLIGNTTGPYGKTEATLNVNSALTANNSTNLGGTAAASYQLNSTLNANIAAYLPVYTGVVNGSSHTVSTSFIANATGVYHTGTMNAASHTVGTSLVANATGVYHTGTMNAASHTVGTAFTANATMTNTVSLVVSTNTATFGTAAYHVANGNFGIGNSAPADKLSVNGSAYLGGGYTYVGGFNTATYPTLGTIGTAFSWNFSAGHAEVNIWNPMNPTTYANTGFRFMQQLTASTYRDLMYIKQDGNVGIGTTAPLIKLQVAGNMGVDAFVECSQNVATSYTITTGKNAMSAGPISINSGVTITVPSGSTWTIV